MANEKEIKSQPTSSSIPPPLDPFPTYQTPYPRSHNEQENPFIQFRRFADDQISSLFNGIPQMFGFILGDNFKSEIEQMMKQHKSLDEGWRKQFEQEMEEMRQSFEKERQAALANTENQKPWWNRGNAAKCPALNGELSQSAALQQELLQKAPDSPNTELELYESGRNKNDNKCHRFSARDTSAPCSGRWMSSLGWDGRQLKDTSRTAPARSVTGSSTEESVIPPSKYTIFKARHLDPIDNSHHTIPWLVLSPYSPVYLCNPDQPRLFKVHIQDNEGVPFQISNPRFRRRWFSTEIDEKLAQHLPWADAFEDLVSLQQTGNMVERDSSTWKTPATWIHDMVSRGSLGSKWEFNQEGQLTRSRSENVSNPKLSPERWSWHHGHQSSSPKNEESNSSDAEAWPSAEEVMQVLKQLDRPIPGEEHPSDDRTQMPLHNVEADVDYSRNPSSTSQSSSSSSTWTYDNTTERADSIISTLTTTKKRTLPDGSIETVKVLKTRFADGSEESDESVEVEAPVRTNSSRMMPKNVTTISSHDKQTQTPVQDEIRKQKKQGGWFWN